MNTSETDAAADLVLSPPESQSNTGIDRTITIPARTQRTLADIVAALGHDGAGGMTVTSTLPEVILTTRTAAETQGGTFGQTIPPVRRSDAQTGQTTSVLAGLASGDGFHTNFGLYNLGSQSITVNFEGSAWAEIRALDADINFTAHASVVDGSTGDPWFIPARIRSS